MSSVTVIIVASLVAGFVLVAGAWLTSPEPWSVPGLDDIGPVNWDFSTSWASNLTVVGAILGTVLSAKILPSATVFASAAGYTSLSLSFGVLVVVAPFVFTALRKGSLGADGLEYKGRGWAFLLASCVTLWGVFGQLVTVGLVFYEAQHAHVLALGAVIPVWVAVGTALILTAYNGVQTIRLLLAAPPAKASRLLGAPVAPAASGRATMASKGWTLL